MEHTESQLLLLVQETEPPVTWGWAGHVFPEWGNQGRQANFDQPSKDAHLKNCWAGCHCYCYMGFSIIRIEDRLQIFQHGLEDNQDIWSLSGCMLIIVSIIAVLYCEFQCFLQFICKSNSVLIILNENQVILHNWDAGKGTFKFYGSRSFLCPYWMHRLIGVSNFRTPPTERHQKESKCSCWL